MASPDSHYCPQIILTTLLLLLSMTVIIGTDSYSIPISEKLMKDLIETPIPIDLPLSKHFTQCFFEDWPSEQLNFTVNDSTRFFCLALRDRIWQISTSFKKERRYFPSDSILTDSSRFDAEINRMIESGIPENPRDICMNFANLSNSKLFEETEKFVSQLIIAKNCELACFNSSESTSINPMALAIFRINQEIETMKNSLAYRLDQNKSIDPYSSVVTFYDVWKDLEQEIEQKKAGTYKTSVADAISMDSEICSTPSDLMNSYYFRRCKKVHQPTTDMNYTVENSELFLCLALHDRFWQICAAFPSDKNINLLADSVLTNSSLIDQVIALNEYFMSIASDNVCDELISFPQNDHPKFYHKTEKFVSQLMTRKNCESACYQSSVFDLHPLCMVIYIIDSGIEKIQRELGISRNNSSLLAFMYDDL